MELNKYTYMETLLISAILVGAVAAIFLLLVWLDKKHKRQAMHQLLQAFSQAGSNHNLSFSSQEILKDTAIGLDGIHRKVLVLRRSTDVAFESLLIDINEVKSCAVKKEYITVSNSDLKTERPERYLGNISLHFELQNKPPVEIVFYKHFNSHIDEIAELEIKAKYWEAILTKMFTPIKKII
jgi:hypothetical protein